MNSPVKSPSKSRASLAFSLLTLIALTASIAASPGDAASSKNDGRIYFDYTEQGQPSFIASVHPDGTGFKKLVRGVDPSASRGSGRVAFNTALGDCYTVNSRGEDRQHVAGGVRGGKRVSACYNQTFSPQGHLIAYDRLRFHREGGHTEYIYGLDVKSPRTGKKTVLANRELPSGAPAFTPNSKSVIYPAGDRLRIAKADGSGNPHTLGSFRTEDASIGSPTVAPNGKSIIFSVYEGDEQEGQGTPLGLYKVNRNGSGAHMIRGARLLDSKPSYSPSGKRVVTNLPRLLTISPSGAERSKVLPRNQRDLNLNRTSWDTRP